MSSPLNLEKQFQFDLQEAIGSDFGANPIRQMELKLLPGEYLLWTGFPYRGILWPRPWRAITQTRIGHTLIATLTLGCFTIGFLNTAPHFTLIIFVILLVVILVKMLIVRPARRRRTYYGMTNKRVFIVRKMQVPSVRTLNIRDIEQIEFKVNRHGSGTIKCFAPGGSGWGKVNKREIKRLKPLFESIPDVPGVYELLERQLNEAKAV